MAVRQAHPYIAPSSPPCQNPKSQSLTESHWEFRRAGGTFFSLPPHLSFRVAGGHVYTTRGVRGQVRFSALEEALSRIFSVGEQMW